MTKRILALLLALLLLGGMAPAVRASDIEDSSTESVDVFTSLNQLNGARIGVQTGTTEGQMVEAHFPKATVVYFNSTTDLTAALAKNKIDAFPLSLDVLRTIMDENDQITYLSEPLSTYDCGFTFSKTESGRKLCEEFNEFLQSIKTDGTLQAMEEKWMSGLDHDPVNIDSLPSTNGKLRMATEATYPPFEYVSNGRYAGFDIELAARFCEARGYGLEIVDMSFDAVIASVPTGKCDFGGSGIEITEERAQNVYFSESYHTVQSVMAVLKSKASAASSASFPEINDFSDLSGKTVSMLTGAPFEELVRSKAPDVREFTFFNNMPDMIMALQSGKTDAVLNNNAIAALAVNRNPDLTLFPQDLQSSTFGFAFAKGSQRRDEWQAAFDTIPDTQIQDAWEKWTGVDESTKVLPAQDWPGLNGTVRVAACDTLEPMSYLGGDGNLKGFDLEVILMVARELDVHVEFTGMEFASILSSVQSGKTDIGAGSIIITEERAQAVDFLDYYPAAFELVVRTTKASATETADYGTFWDGIKSSFNKTFIHEGRWKLFVNGILTTLLITALTILFGTLLGFAVFMMCRNGNPVANLVTHFCLWLVQGMPMVVLLMILYYIIFGSVSISGVAVAVLGFTLMFSSAVFGLLKMGVGAVDSGQYEAAYALGYSNLRTFFRIILPQALPHVLPSYKGEIVGLIKATAIVGYIAVQDLTKMGDIVRSRTYEAFFPLIAITVIYFVLEGLIGFLVSRISVTFNPKRRKPADILKGIRTDD